MTLFKTTFWTGLATLVRIGAGFVVAKVLAVYLGPIGFAFIGQFQNFVTMVLNFSANLIQSGVVKYVAELRDNPTEKTKVLSTAFVICFLSSLVMGVLLIIFKNELASFFLKDKQFTWMIILFGVSLIFYVFNTLATSVMNGEGDVQRLTLANIAGSVLGLVLTYFLAIHFHLAGALAALVLSQSFIFIVTVVLLMKAPFFHWHDYVQGFKKAYGSKLFQFALMAIVSGMTLPLVQLFVRGYIAHVLSWTDAGLWQAMTRLSDAYLLLITSTISVYYLPKFSSLKNFDEFKKEIHQAYWHLLPIVALIALCMFVFKKMIVHVLFSSAFLPMENLFLFQLIGDVFKIGAWIISYNMLAKAMAKIFIVSEILSALSFGLWTVIFIHWFGLKGVTLAFALNYLLYWVFMWWFVYKRLLMESVV